MTGIAILANKKMRLEPHFNLVRNRDGLTALREAKQAVSGRHIQTIFVNGLQAIFVQSQ
jgi:hypothetical protein